MEERTLTAGGIATRVIELGERHAEEAVVLLHGNPGSADEWCGVLPALKGLGRVVAFDLPGYGQADRPREWTYSGPEYAEFVGAALDELGVRRAHLVMHDLGGVALLWAATHPAAFASAVLIDTGSLEGFAWHGFARAYRTPIVGDVIGAVAVRPLLRRGLRWMRPRLPAHAVKRMTAHYDAGTRRAAKRFYRATPAEAMGLLTPALRELDRPALVIWGRHDPFVPAEQAERQRASFPRAEVIVLEDSGHWPHVDDAERVGAELKRFLARQLGAGGRPGGRAERGRPVTEARRPAAGGAG